MALGNWATLSGGGDPVAGLGSTFPSLGGLFSGGGSSNTYGPAIGGYTDVFGSNPGRTSNINSYISGLSSGAGSGGSGSMGGLTGGSDGWGGSGAAGGGGGSGSMGGLTGGDGWGNGVTSSSDVQHPRPGGTALGNNAMGDVGSWGQVPDLTQLWGNDGSFNSGLWDSFTGGTGMAPGGNSAGIFGSGGAAAGGGGMGGGGFDLGSLASMFGGGGLSSALGGMMGGGGGAGATQQQPAASGPDPYQSAYEDLVQQIKDQQTAAQAAAAAKAPQIQFAGGYTQDQLDRMSNTSGLEAKERLKQEFDRLNKPKAEAALKAARTQDQIDADTKADKVKAAQKQASQKGGAYDAEGNYYADASALQHAADDYNAKQAAFKAATDKLSNTAGGTSSGATGSSGSSGSANSGSGSQQQSAWQYVPPTPEQEKQNKLDYAKANGWTVNSKGHVDEGVSNDVIDERPGHENNTSTSKRASAWGGY